MYLNKSKTLAFWSNTGFTLVEMLIVIAVALPLLMVLVGILNSLFRSQNNTQEQEKVQYAVSSIFFDLSREIHNSAQAQITTEPDGDVLTLYSAEGEVLVEYTLFEGTLLKNLTAMHESDLEVTSFFVQDIGKSDGVGLLQISLRIGSKNRSDIQHEKEMAISLRKRSFSSSEEAQ